MVRMLSVSWALLLLTISPLAAGDDAAKAIVNKAIAAHGGKENLEKYPAMTFSGKGTFYGLGQPIEYKADWKMYLPNKMRFDMQMQFNGQNIQFLEVVNEKKGWQKINDMVKELSKDELKEKHFQLYVDQLSQLTPLLKPGVKLSPLGEVKVMDKEAVGVKVTQEGKRDVNLYFDKNSSLLVKTEYEVKEMGMAQTQEAVFSNFKKINGVMQAQQVLIFRDAKKFVESEVTSMELLEKIDSGAFEQP